MNKQEIKDLMAELKLSVEAEFIPWSKSRNYKKGGNMGLNYKVTLFKDGRVILKDVDYGMGIGHCPSYVQSWTGKMSMDEAEAIKRECETGRNQKTRGEIKLDPVDFMYSIVSDADAIDAGGFEDWCSNLGYDTDSRKAEEIYKICVDYGLKLRSALGEAALTKLKEAFQDY